MEFGIKRATDLVFAAAWYKEVVVEGGVKQILSCLSWVWFLDPE